MHEFEVETTTKEEMIDLTEKVSRIVAKSKVKKGLCCVCAPHTTAGIIINENADLHVQEDILFGLGEIAEESTEFKHEEGNSPAHIKSSIVGASKMLIIKDGKPALGTWQGIYLAEFDGPRKRKVWVEIIT